MTKKLKGKVYVPALTKPGLPHLSGMGQRDHRKTKALTSLLPAIRLFIPLSKSNYNSGCQDTVTFASYTGNIR